MSRPILLSISILISNRPDTVRKCLDSIKPLLENVPSELILVDTGCGEDVRKTIGEYTDRIIQFEWCRDFSKARNAGLKKARGKWFLYLDDDEWFEDVADIIRFFVSGEYRSYGVGLYTQRNYLCQDGSEYTELLVGRMICLEPDIEFIHRIHECFNRAPGMPKKLDAFVHHYGYIYQSREQHEAHAMRNISLLGEELEESPRNMRNILQLAQEYNSIGDREKSLKLSLKSITMAEEGTVEDEYCLPPLYANEIICYIELKRYEEAIDRGERHMENRRTDKMVRALIAGQLSAAYLEMEDYNRCLERVEYYWEIYQDYLKNDDEYMEYNLPITNTCFHERKRTLVLGNGVRAAIRLRRDACAWQWFQRIGWEGRRDYADVRMIQDILGGIQMSGEDARSLYREMCEILLEREEWRDFVIGEIMRNCEKPESLSERLKIAAKYRDIASGHWFLKLVRLATAAFLSAAEDKKGEEKEAGETGAGEYSAEQAERMASELWGVMEESMPLMEAYDLFGAVGHFGGSNRQVLESIPFRRWEKGTTWYFSRFSWKDAVWWTGQLEDALEPGSMRMLVWRAAYGMSRASGAAAALEKAETDMAAGIENSEAAADEAQRGMDSIFEGMKEYALCRMTLCEIIYRDEIIETMPDILSVEDRGAYAIRELLEYTEEKQYADAVKLVREIKDLLPGLANIMKQYLKWLEKQMGRQKEESRQAEGEFQVLARQIKAKVYAMMEAGQYQAALTVAEQLQVLMPEDKEILQMKEKILKKC